MRKLFLNVILCAFFTPLVCLSQDGNFWRKITATPNAREAFRKDKAPSDYQMFILDFESLQAALDNSLERGRVSGKGDLVLSFPNSNGGLDKFRVFEANVLHPDLMAKYPGIKSYAGQGIDDPTTTIRFSVSDQIGFHGMVRSGEKATEYIDPNVDSKEEYIVYSRNSLPIASEQLKCLTDDVVGSTRKPANSGSTLRTDDKKLRTYRLALSCNAEYGNIFAGSGSDKQKKSNILAQMAKTITRVNGIYENDLAITLEIIPDNDKLIFYGNVKSDPWTNEFNEKTQETIDRLIGDSNYDIGHNFNTTGGGNAGCIACVCSSNEKGSGYTGRDNPTGDAFDIDYVAHEMGHQFGGYHTMNTCKRSGSGSTEVEPTSGSSIMGYAGICSYNIQSNSDDYFNYVNIRDISRNIQAGTSSSCGQVKALSNEAPTANAGKDYTIPKSTPFILHGEGSDPDGDALTYTWEQNDPEKAPDTGLPKPTWAQGPLFRSVKGTSSPDRYMPALEHVIVGNLKPDYEVVPSVARKMNFALTVRDNKAGGGQTGDDLMAVTVDGHSGPFMVTAPNTNIVWGQGSAQTVTWDVKGTNSSPVNCQKVSILLSTDGGKTYPITLLQSTNNDGSAEISVPNIKSSTCRVMVRAADNIFYDISDTNFSVEDNAVTCTPTVPGGLTASNIQTKSATISWDVVPNAIYRIRYRTVGQGSWEQKDLPENYIEALGLLPDTKYEAQVRSICTDGGEMSTFSSPIYFTTLPEQTVSYCASNSKSLDKGYIGKVVLGDINNSTGGSNTGYADYTAMNTELGKGGEYTITIVPEHSNKLKEGYAVWIDYNQDGNFDDEKEGLFNVITRNSNVKKTFRVPEGAKEGKTRMRVSMKTWNYPGACEQFSYGEVEDYSVTIVANGNTLSKGDEVLDVKTEEFSGRIYPVPAYDLLHVDMNVDHIKGMSVTTVCGQVKGVKRSGNTIDVSSLKGGVYILSVITDKGVTKHTFVKE